MTTRCWNCSQEYAITDAKCPSCGATNANVDFEGAQIEVPIAKMVGDYSASRKFFNKNARVDGKFDAERGLGNNNKYVPGTEPWKQYEEAYNTSFTPTERDEIRKCLSTGEDLSEPLFTKLFEHFCNNGEMPYGVAKARTGDPYEWIGDHMHEVLE